MGFIFMVVLGVALLRLNSYGPALFFDDSVAKPMLFLQCVAWALIGIGGLGTCTATLTRYVVFTPSKAHDQ